MAYSGTFNAVESQIANGVTGVITYTIGTYTFVNGKLVGHTIATSTLSCNCALTCICCCITLDAGGTGCCASAIETIGAGECDTSGGPACAGHPFLCSPC